MDVFRRGLLPERAVGAASTRRPVAPPLDDLLGVGEGGEPMLRPEYSPEQSAIEGFDISIISRFSRAAEVQFDSALVGPSIYRL